MIEQCCPKRTLSEEQFQELLKLLGTITNIPVEELEKEGFNSKNSDELENDLINFLLMKYELYTTKSQAPEEVLKNAQKWLLLETIDQAWKQHMLNLHYLEQGISLRSWGQKNPLLEYKREAFDMFQDMLKTIRWDVVHHIFNINVEQFDEHALEQKRQKELDELNLVSSEESEGSNQNKKPVVRKEEKVGRNDPCPCGSGKKYKKCCMQQ